MTDWNKTDHMLAADFLGAQTDASHLSVNSVQARQSLEISWRSSQNMSDINDIGDPRPQSVNSVQCVTRPYTAKEISQLAMSFAAIERRCPDLVSVADWQRAVDDGRRFLVQWGEQAETLGWTAQDLFGLHDPPERPAPSYRRLSRYDVIGLVWLLHGRPVTALTADRAVIGTAGGAAVTFYRAAIQNG
jgi:hypothetical protein